MALNFANRDPRTRDSTPVILTTGSTRLSITLAAGGAPGAPVALPARDLVNTLKAPIEITELHFLLTEQNYSIVGSTATNPRVGQFASPFELTLALGQRQITRGFVPVSALEVRRDTDFCEGSGIPINRTPQNANTIRWILPQPLILAPNEGFSGMVRASPNCVYSNTGACEITFTMTARGRRLPAGTPVPRRRAIPFASGWIFTRAETPAPDATFRNTFGVPLHVSSINVAPLFWGDGVSVAPNFTSAVTINAPGGAENTVLRGLIAGGVGAGVFGQRQSIEVGHDLNPGEMYQITIADPTGGALAPGTAVNLVGWREE